jgi:simple sugar transport system permease protein
VTRKLVPTIAAILRRGAGTLLVPLAALALTAGLGAAAMAAAGADPLEVYGLLVEGALLRPYGVGQTIFKATPLIFTGLSVALAARAGLFNIGAEGQMIAGAYAMASVGFTFAGLPAVALLPACLAAGALAGAAWAAPPALLRARAGASEVIATILMNWIAVYVFGFVLRRHVAAHPALAETSRTLEIGDGAQLAPLGSIVPALRTSQASVAVLLALGTAAAVAYMLARTRRGFELEAVGRGRDAARAAGIGVERVEAAALLLSGALAGVAGSAWVLGAKHYFEEGMSGGAGFGGIAVAFLGRSRPVGVVLAALLLGALSHGGLVVNQKVPKEIVDVMAALVIATVAAAAEVIDRLTARRLARAAEPSAGNAGAITTASALGGEEADLTPGGRAS